MILAGLYYFRTEDLEFIKTLCPHIELAFEWIERYGDLDGDEFVEYVPSERGLLTRDGKIQMIR